jgi:hypothetical protein
MTTVTDVPHGMVLKRFFSASEHRNLHFEKYEDSKMTK